jgi:hypothetical protein
MIKRRLSKNWRDYVLMGKRFLRCDIETNACHDVCLFLGEGEVQRHQYWKHESEYWGNDKRKTTG